MACTVVTGAGAGVALADAVALALATGAAEAGEIVAAADVTVRVAVLGATVDDASTSRHATPALASATSEASSGRATRRRGPMVRPRPSRQYCWRGSS
jgi:hypothetical protein